MMQIHEKLTGIKECEQYRELKLLFDFSDRKGIFIDFYE